jgi:hypothetical protein
MKGLYNKYIIFKSDDSPIDPEAQYFVLRIDKDQAARVAVLAYADQIEDKNPVFASDIRKMVTSFENTCWDCDQRIGEECGVDGKEVYSDTKSCGSFEKM